MKKILLVEKITLKSFIHNIFTELTLDNFNKVVFMITSNT
jgi:hypothetical protein